MNSKNQIFEKSATLLKELQLNIIKEDQSRPWGFLCDRRITGCPIRKTFFPK